MTPEEKVDQIWPVLEGDPLVLELLVNRALRLRWVNAWSVIKPGSSMLTRTAAGRSSSGGVKKMHAFIWMEGTQWSYMVSGEGSTQRPVPGAGIRVLSMEEAIQCSEEGLRRAGFVLRHGPLPEPFASNMPPSSSSSEIHVEGSWVSSVPGEPSTMGDTAVLSSPVGVVCAQIRVDGSKYRPSFFATVSPDTAFTSTSSLPSCELACIWAEGQLRANGIEFSKRP